jgi:hypothetical protein
VTKALTEVQKNDFQECFQKLAQVCYWPTEELWRKCCVNRCKITYFWQLYKYIKTY